MVWKKLRGRRPRYKERCEYISCEKLPIWALCFGNGKILAVYCDECAHIVSRNLQHPSARPDDMRRKHKKKSKAFKSSESYLLGGE